MEFQSLQSFSLDRSRGASRRPGALLPFVWCDTSWPVNEPTSGVRGLRIDCHLASRNETAHRYSAYRTLRSRVDFRALLPEPSPLCQRQRLGRCQHPMLSWDFILSRAFPLEAARPCRHERSSHELRVAAPPSHPQADDRARQTALTPRSIDSIEAGRVRETRHALLRFFHLVDILHDLGAASSWLMVSPRAPRRVATATGTLFGR